MQDALECAKQFRQGFRAMGGGGQRQHAGLALLGQFALADVARHADAQTVIRRPARAPHDVGHAAILAQVAVFETEAGTAVQHMSHFRYSARFVVGVDEVENDAAGHFFRRITEDRPAGRIDKHDAPALVHHEDGIQ